jgi:hypothetical protein
MKFSMKLPGGAECRKELAAVNFGSRCAYGFAGNCELRIGPGRLHDEREQHKAEHLKRELGSSRKLDGNRVVTMRALESICVEKWRWETVCSFY